VAIAAGFLFLATPGVALGQDRWFPESDYFDRPQAALREPTFALRGVWTDLFSGTSAQRERAPFDFEESDADMQTDAQGEAALGGAVRIWQPATWEGGGMTVGIASAVFGRFRLEVSSSDLVASDWVVGFPVEARRGAWSGRLQLFHWSAHIGDELIETTGAERIDFTHNGLELLLARDLGPIRAYGGGALISASSLENEEQLPEGFSDGAQLRAGLDGHWSRGGSLHLEGGLEFESAERTDWRGRWTVLGGVAVRDGNRSVQLRGVFQDGPSSVGQFFWTDERAWGFELVIELGGS